MSNEWRSFVSGTVRRAACLSCGQISPWHPAGWVFKYVSIKGGPRKGSPKVKTERLCPACVKAQGISVHASAH